GGRGLGKTSRSPDRRRCVYASPMAEPFRTSSGRSRESNSSRSCSRNTSSGRSRNKAVRLRPPRAEIRTQKATRRNTFWRSSKSPMFTAWCGHEHSDRSHRLADRRCAPRSRRRDRRALQRCWHAGEAARTRHRDGRRHCRAPAAARHGAWRAHSCGARLLHRGGKRGEHDIQYPQGHDWSVRQGARIINMSFAGPKDPSLERVLKLTYDRGIVLIAAAGNAGPKSPPLYPGADPNVIAVTATDADDKLFTGANRGKYISVAAPGV